MSAAPNGNYITKTELETFKAEMLEQFKILREYMDDRTQGLREYIDERTHDIETHLLRAFSDYQQAQTST